MSQKNNKNYKNNKSSGNRNSGGKSTGNSRKNQVSSKVAGTGISSLWIIPLAFVIIVVPLITIIHSYDCGLEKYPWFTIGGNLYDFFLYYKAFFLRLIAVLILFMLAYLIPFKDHGFLKEKKTIAPSIAIGIFGLVSLLSCLLCNHKHEAFFGGYEQFEGWFVILCYILCFYMAFGYVRTKKLIRFFLDFILIGGFIAGVLGTFQAIGIDWIQSNWAKPILAAEISDTIDMSTFSVTLNFGKGMSYVTLYNPNYVGSYVALMLPYAAYLIFRGEKIWRRVLAGLTSALLIITLIASQSKTGILGLMVGAVVCAILIIPILKKTRPLVFIGLGLAAAGVIAIVVMQPGLITGIFHGSEEYGIDNMSTSDDELLINTESGKKIHVSLDSGAVSVPEWSWRNRVDQVVSLRDDSGNEISATYDAGTGIETINEDGYEPISFNLECRSVDETTRAIYLSDYARVTGQSGNVSSDDSAGASDRIDLLIVTSNSFGWAFTVVDGKIMNYNDFGRLDNMRNISKAGFENNYLFASRRGYIWSRTIPLLKKTLLFGIGRDQFVYEFPNDDYLGKRYVWYNTQTITKPHDLFLQIWTQDGLPALLAFLFLYILFMIRTFRRCLGKNRSTPESGIDLHSFVIITAVAATAYIVVGIANDSTITSAPIYWCILGAGYAADAALTKLTQTESETEGE